MTVAAVTGPFSYTGKYIAALLQERGDQVRGFVRTQPPVAESSGIDCRPLQFANLDQLARDLDGVDVLYNTYWIRFERAGSTFDGAVRNTGVLADAARLAGVRRLVHLSVSNPSPDSPFGYYRGKAAAEEAIAAAGIPLTIIRPTLVFGREDILVNNLAWLVRTMPVFPIPGDGCYRVQPVFVGDVAGLAVEEGGTSGSRVRDAAGPQTTTFDDFMGFLRTAVGGRARFFHAPVGLALAMAAPLSILLRDVMITREEFGGLMAETLISHEPPTASTSLASWLSRERVQLGARYTSELQRHWTAPLPSQARSRPGDGRGQSAD